MAEEQIQKLERGLMEVLGCVLKKLLEELFFNIPNTC